MSTELDSKTTRVDAPSPPIAESAAARPRSGFFFGAAAHWSHYLYRIIAAEISALTRYSERVIQDLHPWKQGQVGLHTMNCSAGLSVIDSLRLARL